MRVLRQSGIVKRTAVWSALVATLLHVALLSLHVTASFEQAVAAPTDTANLGIHALCGPGFSTLLSDDGSGLPAQPAGKSLGSCPVCTSAAPTACLNAPEPLVAPVVFNVAAAPPPPAITVPAARPLHVAGSIRGPPPLA